MQFQRFPLPPGNHELQPAVYDCQIDSVLPELGVARLVLAVGPPHKEALARHEATNLAILVTIDSVAKIGAQLSQLAKTMAKVQQPSNEGQSLGQSIVGEPQPGPKRPKDHS